MVLTINITLFEIVYSFLMFIYWELIAGEIQMRKKGLGAKDNSVREERDTEKKKKVWKWKSCMLCCARAQ